MHFTTKIKIVMGIHYNSWEESIANECECYMGFLTSTIATPRFTKMQHRKSLGKAMDLTSMVHQNALGSSATQNKWPSTSTGGKCF
jgi:hypothetical protein